MTGARRARPRDQELGHEAVVAEVMNIRLYEHSGVPMMTMATVTLRPVSLAISVPVIEEPPGEAAVVHQGGLGVWGVELGGGRVSVHDVGGVLVMLTGVGGALGPPGLPAARLPDILHRGRQGEVGRVGSELWIVVEVMRGVAMVTIHLHRPRGEPGGVAGVVSAVHGVSGVVSPSRAPPPAPGVWVGREGPGWVAPPVILVVVAIHPPEVWIRTGDSVCFSSSHQGSSDSLAVAGLGHSGIELTCNTAIYHHLQTSLNNPHHHQACQTLVGLGQTIAPVHLSLLSQQCLPGPRQS